MVTNINDMIGKGGCVVSVKFGVREAKANLSKILKMVKNGNEVVLTERGRPVGKIVQVQSQDLTLSTRIKNLEEQGVLSPEKKNIRELPLPIEVPDNIAQTFLKQDRENG